MENTDANTEECAIIPHHDNQADVDTFIKENFLLKNMNEEIHITLETKCSEYLNSLYEKKLFDSYVKILEKGQPTLSVNFVQPYILKIRDIYFDGFTKLVILYWHDLSEDFIKSLFYNVNNKTICNNEQIIRFLFGLSGFRNSISNFSDFKKSICEDAIFCRLSCANFLITQFSEKELSDNNYFLAGSIMKYLCLYGTEDTIRFFLEYPPIKNNISRIKDCGRNILYMACLCENEENVERPLETVLKSGLVDSLMANEMGRGNKTPLQICIEHQSLECVKMLLDKGLICKFYCDIQKYSWLFEQNYDVLKLLFSAGLFDKIINSKSNTGETILHTVVGYFKSKKIITDLLCSTLLTEETFNSKVNGRTFLHYACDKYHCRSEEVIDYIIDSGHVIEKFVKDFINEIKDDPKITKLYNLNSLKMLCTHFELNAIFDDIEKKIQEDHERERENKCAGLKSIIESLETQLDECVKAFESNENIICEFQDKIQDSMECVEHLNYVIGITNGEKC